MSDERTPLTLEDRIHRGIRLLLVIGFLSFAIPTVYAQGIGALSEESALILFTIATFTVASIATLLRRTFPSGFTTVLEKLTFAISLPPALLVGIIWLTRILKARPNFFEWIWHWKTPEAYEYAGRLPDVIFFSALIVFLAVMIVSMLRNDWLGPNRRT